MAKPWKVCNSKLKSIQAAIDRFQKAYVYLLFCICGKGMTRIVFC